MDVSRYARFLRPGHRGHRRSLAASTRLDEARTRVGYDYAHAIVDDHSRLAYVELHDDERAVTVTGFVERALAFFDEHGIACKRLMTDNAFGYVKSHSLRGLGGMRDQAPDDRALPAVHERQGGTLPPTMAREWAYGLAYRSHRQRNEALPHWLDHYNRGRPHSSLGDRPPISRVHNVRG